VSNIVCVKSRLPPSPTSPPWATRAELPPPPRLWPLFYLVSGLLAGCKGSGEPSFSRSSPSRFRVCSSPIIGGGVRFCRRSMAPLWLGFPGGDGTMRKRRRCREITSPSFFRSPMVIYSDVNGEAGETCPGVEGRRIVVFFR
jgi:hypothetical protein